MIVFNGWLNQLYIQYRFSKTKNVSFSGYKAYAYVSKYLFWNSKFITKIFQKYFPVNKSVYLQYMIYCKLCIYSFRCPYYKQMSTWNTICILLLYSDIFLSKTVILWE